MIPRPVFPFVFPSRFRLTCLFLGQAAITAGSSFAQLNDGNGTLTFQTGASNPPSTVVVSNSNPPVQTVVFEPSAVLQQGLLVDVPDAVLGAGAGSAIQPSVATAFALKFSSTGATMTANGMTLANGTGTDGTLSLVQPASITLNNSTVSTASTSTDASAVRMQAGGSLSMTGGSLIFNPSSPTSAFRGYAFRGAGGTTKLTLENVTVTGGTTTSHRSFGIGIQGGGEVTLKGDSTTVTARQNPALDLNGEFTVTSTAALTTLTSAGTVGGTAVRLSGGATGFTQAAAGKIDGSASEAGLLLESTATGSGISNAGIIRGIVSGIEATAAGHFEVSNSGEISGLGTGIDGINSRGGKFTNQTGGTISGNFGITCGFGPGILDVTNSGTISGANTGITGSGAGNFSILNQGGASITGGTTGTATFRGVNLSNFAAGGSLTNHGLITANDAIVLDGGTPAASGTVAVTNSGEITAINNSAIQVFGRSDFTFGRDISITNSAGGVVRGGLVTPSFFSIAFAAVHASNTGNGDIMIDNHGTIDARSRGMAIGVSTSDSSQAVITLHEGSSTLGTIRSVTPFGTGTGTILAFSGNGSYAFDVSGISGLRKADAGTWTYGGERNGSSVEVTAGELVLTRRTTGSGAAVNVSGGKLTVAPTVPDAPGIVSLSNNNADIGAGGELILGSSARAAFGGNAGVQRVHDGGLFVIDGSADFSASASFPCTVDSNGRLAGDGAMTGYAVFSDGGALEPGNGSAGDAGDFALVSTSSGSGLTFADGGVYRWSLAAYSEANPGVDSDLIVLNNLGSVLFQSGSRLDLDFASLGGAPDPLETVNVFWRSDRSWPLITGGAVTTPENLLFAATNQSTYPIPGAGTFSISPDGRTLLWAAETISDPFGPWIDSFAAITDPLRKTKSADADGDGENNLLEFALDGDPADPASTGKTRGLISEVSGIRYYTLTLPVRAGAAFSGPGDLVSAPVGQLIYRIQGSADLADLTSRELVEVTPALSAGLPALGSDEWEYRTFRLSEPVASRPSGFIRAGVQEAP